MHKWYIKPFWCAMINKKKNARRFATPSWILKCCDAVIGSIFCLPFDNRSYFPIFLCSMGQQSYAWSFFSNMNTIRFQNRTKRMREKKKRQQNLANNTRFPLWWQFNTHTIISENCACPKFRSCFNYHH